MLYIPGAKKTFAMSGLYGLESWGSIFQKVLPIFLPDSVRTIIK